MNKTIFYFLLFILFCTSHFIQAQCVTPINYADSVFGVWPDTIQNLPRANQNQSYLTTMYFKAPTNVRDIDPSLPSITVDSFKLSDISGLPPGFTFACDNNRCKWNGGDVGCVEIQGTPTDDNTYELTLKSIGYGFLFSTVSAPYDFEGYRIIVDREVGIAENSTNNLNFSPIFPNPFSSKSIIKINAINNTELNFYIFDIAGKKVNEDVIIITSGMNEYEIKELLQPGIYFYQFTSPKGEHYSGKMTVIY
jgi:hypothetical protein